MGGGGRANSGEWKRPGPSPLRKNGQPIKGNQGPEYARSQSIKQGDRGRNTRKTEAPAMRKIPGADRELVAVQGSQRRENGCEKRR